MNKYNTLLGQLLSQVKRPEFDKLCRTMNSDKFRKTFNTWDQFVVMAFAQITGQNGLRSIENALNGQIRSFYHLGLSNEVKRSTISYANKTHSPDFFEALYYQLFSGLERGARKLTEKKLYAIDATTIGLKMNLKKGDFVTFDRGYNNYTQFSEFCKDTIYFVTRLKDNASYKVIKTRKTYSKKITSDQIIQFTGYTAEKKCPNELRHIRSVDSETGKAIVLLTNMRSCTAKKVAEIYRKRWRIELFFKTIKQNLKIKCFYGTTENAVKTQIWIAMIVYLLFMLLKKATGCITKSFTHFISEIAVSLFQRIDLSDWLSGSSPPIAVHDPSISHLQKELWA
ncbi:MAG TPA: IS4 family transposase [Treponemataceae bacterium]|nr:IS4 family transposase [Treponemataceae bacterium]